MGQSTPPRPDGPELQSPETRSRVDPGPCPPCVPSTNRRPPRRLGQLRPQRCPVVGQGFNAWIWGQGPQTFSPHPPGSHAAVIHKHRAVLPCWGQAGTCFLMVPVCAEQEVTLPGCPMLCFCRKAEGFVFAQKPKATCAHVWAGDEGEYSAPVALLSQAEPHRVPGTGDQRRDGRDPPGAGSTTLLPG